jgi:glucose-1-phosphate cytidylyltransferase
VAPEVKVLLLCGGRGSRAYPFTRDVPKPLLAIGGKPILGHVMDIYARHGVHDFVLAAGYRADAIADYAASLPTDWCVDVVDTGLDAGTGGRVVACLDRVGETFHASYGDGVGNVDIGRLFTQHRERRAGATVTSVPLPSQYGTLDIDADGTVIGFKEKPRLTDHWINAGFFVFERDLIDQNHGDDLEREILPALSRSRVLQVYRHEGFWASMDTYRDQMELDALAQGGTPPWAS